MSLASDYSMVNRDLRKKFEIQPVDREGMPVGDLLQISVPNLTPEKEFQLLIQAFIQASKTAHAPPDSYWASNIVFGIGMGVCSFAEGWVTGVGGVIYQPIIETKK